MILCITHSQDYYNIELVMRALSDLGEKPVRFNSDSFSFQNPFCYSIKNSGSASNVINNGTGINPAEIKAVWNRKLWNTNTPEDMDADYRSIYFQEYYTMRQIFLDALNDKVWFNPIKAERAVEQNKLWQLEIAAKNGLSIPATIMTNNEQQVRDFYDELGGQDIIVKMHGALSVSMAGNTPAFPTARINENHFSFLDTLSYCPMIFQKYISKAYELRIAYVDGILFAGKLAVPDQMVDWRKGDSTQLKWQPYELPEALSLKITNTMKDLGLLFGALDIIRNTDGDYVFLEVNPSGEWGMLQMHLNYPIAETIAQKIVEKIK